MHLSSACETRVNDSGSRHVCRGSGHGAKIVLEHDHETVGTSRHERALDELKRAAARAARSSAHPRTAPRRLRIEAGEATRAAGISKWRWRLRRSVTRRPSVSRPAAERSRESDDRVTSARVGDPAQRGAKAAASARRGWAAAHACSTAVSSRRLCVCFLACAAAACTADATAATGGGVTHRGEQALTDFARPAATSNQPRRKLSRPRLAAPSQHRV